MRASSIHRLLLPLVALAAFGCTTARESFPGHDADGVWSAMIDAAEIPDYTHADPARRWAVRENEVWVDEAGRRIELRRWLVRERTGPEVVPRREERRLRLRLTLEPTDPPTIVVASVEPNVPAHLWDEAERYFDDVRSTLATQYHDDLDALGLDDGP